MPRPTPDEMPSHWPPVLEFTAPDGTVVVDELYDQDTEASVPRA